MLRSTCIALTALCFFVQPALAGLYRIEVHGSYTFADINGDILAEGGVGELKGWSFDSDDANWGVISSQVSYFSGIEIGVSKSGTASYQGGSFFDCVGLLEYLCVGGSSSVSSFDPTSGAFSREFGGYSGGHTVNNHGIDLGYEWVGSFEVGGVTYSSAGLGTFGYEASFDDVSVTSVPLPAGGFLLMAGLSVLAAGSLRHVQRRAGRFRRTAVESNGSAGPIPHASALA